MTITARWAGQGLAAGAALTTSLAGSGDTPLTTLNGTSGTVTATGGPGPSGIRLSFTPTGGTCYMEWGPAVVGSLTAMAARIYLRFTAWPASSFSVLRANNSAAAQQWAVDLGGSGSPGQIRLKSNANSTLVSSATNVLSLNADHRIEVVWDSSGTATVTAYAGHSLTPLATLSGSTGGTGPVAAVRFGQTSGPTLAQYYASDVALANTAALIGPAQAPSSTLYVWNGTALTSATLRGVWDGAALQPAVLRT